LKLSAKQNLKLNTSKLLKLLCLVSLFHVSTAFLGTPSNKKSSNKTPKQFEDVGLDEKLGDMVSIDKLVFTDENGKKVKLSKFFSPKKPVVLIIGYYKCPMLCSLVFNGFTIAAKSLNWSIGIEYEVVNISVNPKESYEVAKAKKKNYVNQYGRLSAKKGWHFLTGDEENIKKLTSQVGFKYKYDKTIKQYAHTALLTFLSPKGKVSRYLYGISFKHNDLKLAIQEASDGTVGTTMEKFLLYCFQYDPDSDSYSFTVLLLMELGGVLTLLIFGGYLFRFWRKEIILAKKVKKVRT